jgi:hypothetical protein
MQVFSKYFYHFSDFIVFYKSILFANTSHGNTFTGNMGFFAKSFEGMDTSVMGGNQAEAGGAAVHGVVLEIGGKRVH